jgi:hypothetical protein
VRHRSPQIDEAGLRQAECVEVSMKTGRRRALIIAHGHWQVIFCGSGLARDLLILLLLLLWERACPRSFDLAVVAVVGAGLPAIF